MTKFICRIYCYYHADSANPREEWAIRPVPLYSRTTVSGWSRRHAAAKAYVTESGAFRSAVFQRLGSPEPAVQFEKSIVKVSKVMKQSHSCKGACYYFDNGVEVFYVVVTTIAEERRITQFLKAAVRVMCFN